MASFYYNYLRIKAQLLNVYPFQKVDMTTFLADIKCEIDGGYGQFGIYPAPWRTTPGNICSWAFIEHLYLFIILHFINQIQKFKPVYSDFVRNSVNLAREHSTSMM